MCVAFKNNYLNKKRDAKSCCDAERKSWVPHHIFKSFFILIGLGFVLASAQANAGQLFPPYSLQANPNQSCPNAKVLSWQRIANGDTVVDCVDPTPGVTTTGNCDAGSYATGITSGKPNCQPLPNCPSGQALTGFNSDGSPKCRPAAVYVAVPFPVLNQYHGGCSADRGNGGIWSADTTAYCTSACDSWCRGQSYAGGTITQWDGPDNLGYCVCSGVLAN